MTFWHAECRVINGSNFGSRSKRLTFRDDSLTVLRRRCRRRLASQWKRGGPSATFPLLL
jgi:hypothetical protein